MIPVIPVQHSRKAWIVTTNVVCSVVVLLLGHYLDPNSANFYIGIVAIVQPAILMWIKTIADEDNSRRTNDTLLTMHREANP